MYCVPLMSASPSLASSTTGVEARARAMRLARAGHRTAPSVDLRASPFADHRERQVRERREIARGADRALRRDARVHAAR